jgi:NDP-sugar pyrophosphorylase family protein
MSSGSANTEAVILAAGIGSRLRPLTLERPKPLIEVHGTPILHNALWHLAAAGIRRTTLVVGYRKEVIERSCGRRFANMDVTYIESDVFDQTGSAYSLWLARDTLLHGPCVLLEGDVFFEPSILARLLASPHSDVAAVAPFTDVMSGSAVTLSDNGLVQRVFMNQSAGNRQAGALFKTMNLYRFGAHTLRDRLVPALEDTLRGTGNRAYVEQVLGRLVNESGLRLGTEICGDLNWFEIDSQDDLRIAERIFAPAAVALGAARA